MAQLGFRSIDEMIGRSDLLDMREAIGHYKARGLDFSKIFYRPETTSDVEVRKVRDQEHGIEQTLDWTTIVPACKPALERGEPVSLDLKIRNVNRTVGTILGSEVSRRYGGAGLPDDTIKLTFHGSAGQSFGAFAPRGVSLTLEGDSNDYVGKGLSGGKIVVFPPKTAKYVAEDNVLIGNVALYGATAGQAFFRGRAGERFCVRNSGAQTVVEGIGDHGCEYMTGGVAVVIGPTGRNFAAGMSGGVAFVLDETGDFASKLQPRNGRPRKDDGIGRPRSDSRPLDPARRLHRQHRGRPAALGLGMGGEQIRQGDAPRLSSCPQRAEEKSRGAGRRGGSANGGDPWVSPAALSRFPASCRRGARCRNGCTTTSKSTTRSPRRSSRRKARDAWTAGFRSVIRAAPWAI